MCLAVVAGLDPIAHLPPDLVSRVKVLVDDDRHTEAGRLIPGDVPDLFAFSGTPDQGGGAAPGPGPDRRRRRPGGVRRPARPDRRPGRPPLGHRGSAAAQVVSRLVGRGPGRVRVVSAAR
ncbi:hypothetical protein GCM10023259_082550 [Thermocatellispora tengchongensis]